MELHAANKRTIAATAIDFIGQYGIEREIKELRPEQRKHLGTALPRLGKRRGATPGSDERRSLPDPSHHA